ncbi:hypothetical protein Tco_0563795 [Tanacetum coccineum]
MPAMISFRCNLPDGGDPFGHCPEDLIMDNNYTLRDLRTISKERKIKGYTKYHKSELAKLLGINVIEAV